MIRRRLVIRRRVVIRVVGRRGSINIGLRGSHTSGNEAKSHGTNHPRPMPRASEASHFPAIEIKTNKFL